MHLAQFNGHHSVVQAANLPRAAGWLELAAREGHLNAMALLARVQLARFDPLRLCCRWRRRPALAARARACAFSWCWHCARRFLFFSG
jgi:TPR repeat protein